MSPQPPATVDFIHRHPDEVAGIVLVDSLYPRVIKKRKDFPFLTRVSERLFFSRMVSREIDSIYETGEQVLAQGNIDNKRMIRMVNQPKGASAIPVDLGMINNDPQTIAFVKTMYQNAKTVIVDSDHKMQTASPEEVIKAIKEVIVLQRDMLDAKSGD